MSNRYRSILPLGSTSFSNTKSYNNEYNGNIIGATANVGDLSYLNNQGIISASVWFKVLAQTNGTFQFLTMVGGRTSYFRFQLNYDTTGAFPRANCFLIINNTQALLGNATVTLNNGWHHFLCTYDTSVGGKFYINGNQVLNPTIAQASFTTTTVKPTFFSGTGILNEYNATQLAIWNRVLTSQEVQDVYNNGCPSDLSSLNPNTWLKMDDATGDATSTTITDSGSDNATIESLIPFTDAIETDSPCP